MGGGRVGGPLSVLRMLRSARGGRYPRLGRGGTRWVSAGSRGGGTRAPVQPCNGGGARGRRSERTVAQFHGFTLFLGLLHVRMGGLLRPLFFSREDFLENCETVKPCNRPGQRSHRRCTVVLEPCNRATGAPPGRRHKGRSLLDFASVTSPPPVQEPLQAPSGPGIRGPASVASHRWMVIASYSCPAPSPRCPS